MSIEPIGGNNWAGWVALAVSLMTFAVYLATALRGGMRDIVKDLRERVADCERERKDTEDENRRLRRENDYLLRRVARLDHEHNGTR